MKNVVPVVVLIDFFCIFVYNYNSINHGNNKGYFKERKGQCKW